MNALRRLLYRGALSYAICFLIALTMYNVNIKHHKPPLCNCHSDDKYGEDDHNENCHNEYKHSISIGILIPSTTKYIDVHDLENLSLMSIALPSISFTMEV